MMKPKQLAAGAAGFYLTRRYVERRVDELRTAALEAQSEGGSVYRSAADRFFRFQKFAGVLPWIASLAVARIASRLLR